MKNDIGKIIKESVRTELIRESVEGGVPDINIYKIDSDERSPRRGGPRFHVNYQINDIEIEGTLRPFHTGRDMEYEFEPSYFIDEIAESYYDDNWEKIEEEILNKLYEGL